ncbi:hypothetical protein HJFPF1_05501 [Paramyrothecium foliicola]|nr:hypothetical protein HJFPF1_05501 [Paramyrothecium foliicola]
MKYFVITSILASVASAQNTHCSHEGGVGSTVSRYSITVSPNPFPDTPGICGGLWDNLKRFPGCAAPSMTDCRDEFGVFSWDFDASIGCNAGMVESAWWEATQNSGGAIDC